VLIYNPDSGYTEKDTFTYQVTDNLYPMKIVILVATAIGVSTAAAIGFWITSMNQQALSEEQAQHQKTIPSWFS
jgi:hypothetical protein